MKWLGIITLLGALALDVLGIAQGVGVWVDDGHGNTILADSLDSEEAKDLANDMLDLLDLPAPPAIEGRHGHHHHKSKEEGSGPNWIKNIFDNLDEHGHATVGLLDAEHRKTVTAADTIITFINRDPPSGRVRGSNKRLYFDVSDVPLDHSLLSAEIHLYRHPGYKTEELLLHVYMLTDDKGDGETAIAELNLQESGWVTINITTAVLSWLIFPDTNFGLRLGVTSVNLRHEQHFYEVGLIGVHDEERHRPFMVGFFALPEDSPYRGHVRVPRSVSAPPKSKPRKYRDIADNKVKLETFCRMRHLHVSFRDLGWEEWVIAPEGYDANYCEGNCHFPLQGEMNATNHAIVQTLVKVIEGVSEDNELPPNACCAPIDLATIPVLYYSNDNNIVLKKYPKMIVKTCGCH